MIIIKIFQGLGNQLFQYALAKGLSERHGIPFKLDLEWYKTNSGHRKFGLDRFNIQYEVASNEEIYNVRNGLYANRIANFVFRTSLYFKPYYKQPFFHENLLRLDKNILKINSRTYIEGYFTSEFFFEDCKDVIKQSYTLKSTPLSKSREIINSMQNSNSVCLSVRRGDFVKNTLHDVCNISYYQAAIDHIGRCVKRPVIYVFSDDNQWVKDNLIIREYEHHYVDHNFPDYFEDFRLMQSCKHHIIPNSTFSWWAAWLCNNEEKIVVAPRKWLNTTEIDYSYFLPKEWVKIENN